MMSFLLRPARRAIALVAAILVCSADNEDGFERLLPDVTGEQLQRSFESFQQLGACGDERNTTAKLEFNRVFDGTWNVKSGEVHASVRELLREDPSAYAMLVRRAFTSGRDYIITEVSYVDCAVRFVKKHGFRPHMRILGKDGLHKRSSASLKLLLTTLLLAIDFRNGKLILSQHLTELMVETIERSVQEHLHGTKRAGASKLIAEYGALLPNLDQRVEELGRLLEDVLEDELDDDL